MAATRFGLLQAATVLAISCPVVCHSQDAAQTAGENSGVLERIVVTAEKRPSVAQETAIALSAFSGETLAENGVSSLTDLSSIAPSVNFGTQINQTIVVIRGVSTRDTTEVGDPAVSVSIDGFNLQRASGLNTSMFDLERVEVLRGPQGTLLGRNATGGAINIITAKPADDFSSSLSAEVGSHETFNTNGHVNLPVNDWLNVRAAFQTQSHDGYRDNAPAKDADDEDSQAARLSLAFDPTERLSGIITAEYSRTISHGPAYYATPVETYTAANVPPGLLVGDIILDQPAIHDARFPLPPGQHVNTDITNVRGTFSYDLDFATLTYVGGWRRMDVDRLTSHGGAFGTIRQNFAFQVREYPRSWNHELRLNGDPEARFFWQVGAFYFDEKNSLPVSQFVDYPGSPGFVGHFVPLSSFVSDRIDAEAKAMFGQVSYEVLPKLKIEAGARYSEDSKMRRGANGSTSLGDYLTTRCGARGSSDCVYTVSPVNWQGDWSQPTYHAGLNYQATPNNLLYAKFDTGYKAGGFTQVGNYGPEKIQATEIGSKNRFLDDTLQVNLAAFYYDDTDQQVSQFITLPNGSPLSVIVNAGKSEYKGVEMDVAFKPTSSDTLDLYVAYTDSQFTDFKLAVGGLYRRIAAAEGKLDALGNWQLAGRAPPQSPEWGINAGYDRDWPFFGGTLNTRVQTHYESESYFSVQNNDSDKQKAYTKTDLLVTYKPPTERWELQGYVRNLEDSLILTNSADASSTAFLTYRYQFAAPRTYGVRWTMNW